MGQCHGEMNEREVHFLECGATFHIQCLALPHQATAQLEGSNALLGYFMKVAGDRGDVQTGLIAAVDFGDNAQTTGETQQQPGLPVP